jgi:hypothetical protein
MEECATRRVRIANCAETSEVRLARLVLTTMYNRAGMVPVRRNRFEASMPTTDERIAYLEGRFEEHSGSVTTIRGDFAAVRSDVQDVRRHVATLDERISARIETLDSKMSRQFTWIVGIQVAMLIAVIGALLRVAAP